MKLSFWKTKLKKKTENNTFEAVDLRITHPPEIPLMGLIKISLLIQKMQHNL